MVLGDSQSPAVDNCREQPPRWRTAGDVQPSNGATLATQTLSHSLVPFPLRAAVVHFSSGDGGPSHSTATAVSRPFIAQGSVCLWETFGSRIEQ